MDTVLIILAFILLLGSIVGCILPILPSVPLAYGGLILLHLTDKIEFSTSELLIGALLVVSLQILDYLTPLLGSKYSGGTGYGNRGCMAGTLLGLFFMPWGIILGPFIGAVIGELLGGQDMKHAIRSGIGSLLGFLLGTLLKLVLCFYWLCKSITIFI